MEHHLKLPLESLPWANARDVGSRQLWRAAFTTYYVALLILVSFISLYTLRALASPREVLSSRCVRVGNAPRLIQLP